MARAAASLGGTSCPREANVSFVPCSCPLSHSLRHLSSTEYELLGSFLLFQMFTLLTLSGFLLIRSLCNTADHSLLSAILFPLVTMTLLSFWFSSSLASFYQFPFQLSCSDFHFLRVLPLALLPFLYPLWFLTHLSWGMGALSRQNIPNILMLSSVLRRAAIIKLCKRC